MIGLTLKSWLNIYTPDIVTLIIGTNDTGRGYSIRKMSSDLSGLIDKITQQLPDAQLLVASIPPINPNGQSQARVQKAFDFNAAIPDIIHDKVAEGKSEFCRHDKSDSERTFLAANG